MRQTRDGKIVNSTLRLVFVGLSLFLALPVVAQSSEPQSSEPQLSEPQLSEPQTSRTHEPTVHVEDPADALVAAHRADALHLARAVDRLGDASVLVLMQDASSRSVRQAAIVASPFLQGPEHALVPLSRLATRRDRRMAALAAWSLVRILSELTADGLVIREATLGSLRGARQDLQAMLASERGGADIRMAVTYCVHRLNVLLESTASQE